MKYITQEPDLIVCKLVFNYTICRVSLYCYYSVSFPGGGLNPGSFTTCFILLYCWASYLFNL